MTAGRREHHGSPAVPVGHAARGGLVTLGVALLGLGACAVSGGPREGARRHGAARDVTVAVPKPPARPLPKRTPPTLAQQIQRCVRRPAGLPTGVIARLGLKPAATGTVVPGHLEVARLAPLAFAIPQAGGTGIDVWDLRSGQRLRRLTVPARQLQGSPSALPRLIVSPDGGYVLLFHDDGPSGHELVLRDTRSGRELWRARPQACLRDVQPRIGHRAFCHVAGAAFGPGGRTVLTSEWDQRIRVRDAKTGRLLGTYLAGARGPLAVSPDDRWVVVGGFAPVRMIWRGGRPWFPSRIGRPSRAKETRRIRFLGGQGVVFLEGRPYDLRSGRAAPRHAPSTSAGARLRLRISPDGRHAAAVLDGGQHIDLWTRTAGGQWGIPKRLVVAPCSLTSIRFAGDGHQLYALGVGVDREGMCTGRIWRWRVADGRALSPVNTLSKDRGDILHVAISPDGRHLATDSQWGVLRLWRLPDLELVRTWRRDPAERPAFSPDGRLLAFAEDSGQSGQPTLVVWDLQRRRERRYQGPSGFRFDTLAFAPGGRWLLLAYKPHFWRLDLATGKLRQLGQSPTGPAHEGLRLVRGGSMVSYHKDGYRTHLFDLTTRSAWWPLPTVSQNDHDLRGSAPDLSLFVIIPARAGADPLGYRARLLGRGARPVGLPDVVRNRPERTPYFDRLDRWRFSPSGRLLMHLPRGSDRLIGWDLRNPGHRYFTLPIPWSRDLAVSPDDSVIAVGEAGGVVTLYGVPQGRAPLRGRSSLWWAGRGCWAWTVRRRPVRSPRSSVTGRTGSRRRAARWRDRGDRDR